MIRFVFSIIFFFSWFTGCLICEKVHQSPSDVLCKPNDSVNLTCRHDIASYDTILWYQRSYGDSSLKLIGYAQYSSLTPNMIRFVFSIIFFLSWFTGCLICEKVHQSPSDVLCKPNDSVNLTCRHNIASYDTILWYQRSYGDSSLKLIGYARYSSMKEFEPSYKGNFKLMRK
ncbi:hypothetical protein QQF64_011298 [Cirrhinus molitorella]|uniref:Immunoglobulin V-set domain-containing protein n=1 Tax=Cirrhinus molitorella TaxID=172907 RepID=A0ABR3M1W7_9TELE